MAFRIDDDENRIQDLKDQIDQLEIQTFSPEVVARNESTRNTGVQTGDAAATNAYPQWIPIRDFGLVGNLTLDIVLNRTDSHVAKLTAIGDIDFAFSLPPGTNKIMEFILDVTVDGIGGYTLNLLNNILPAGILINNSANARTVIRFTTTDAGVTYYAENISISGTGGGGNVPDGTAQFQHLQWDGIAWIAQQELQFGADFADAGQIQLSNDQIGMAWRNAANDGNIEIKTNSTDILDITNSANNSVILSLRAQDALFLDIQSSWSQNSNIGGLGGTTTFTYPTEMAFEHGATLVALFDSTDEINFFNNIDVNINDIIKVDRLQLSGGTPSATSVNDVVWYLSSAGDLVSNINATDGWIWSSGNITKMILTDSTLEKRNVTAPVFQLYNTRVPQIGTAGTINILANSVDNLLGAAMGFIIADTEIELGDGSGSLKFGVNLNGISTSFMSLNDNNNGQVDILKETDFNSQDVRNINRLHLVGGTTSALGVDEVSWYLTSNDDLINNIGAGSEWGWSLDNIIKMILTDSTLEKRNVTAPVFQLYNTRTAQTGTAGVINILANSVGIPTGVPMGFIIADTEVETGNGSGSISFGVNLNGIPTNFIKINDNNDGNVKFLSNLDLGGNFIKLVERALPTNPAPDTGLIYLRDNGGITTPFFLDSGGTETSLLGGVGGDNLGNHIATQDLNMSFFGINNVQHIIFDDEPIFTIPIAKPGIGYDNVEDKLRFNVPLNNTYLFAENGSTSGIVIDPTGGIDLNDGSLTSVNNITMNQTNSTISGVEIINFNVNQNTEITALGRLDFFQPEQDIISNTAGLRFNIDDLQAYTFLIGSFPPDQVLKIEESAVDVFQLNMLNHSIVNTAAISIVDTGGVPRGSISGDASGAMRVSLPINEKFIISEVITDIISIDDTTGITIEGSHVINMGNNIINTISELQLSNANAHTPSNELTIAFDTNDDALKYSVPLTTDSHMFFADTDLLASFSRIDTNEGLLSIHAVTATSLQTTETLLLSTFNNTTPTNGEIWRDTTSGLFLFRENGITVNLGASGGDNLGNHIATQDLNMNGNIIEDVTKITTALNPTLEFNVSLSLVAILNEFFIDFFVDLNMNGNILTLDANKTTSINGTSTDIIQFLTASSLRMSIDNDGVDMTVDLKMFENEIILDGGGSAIISGVTGVMNFGINLSTRMSITSSLITMTEELSMLNSNKITNVLDPTNPQDVVTKAFGDANYLGGSTSFIGFTADANLVMGGFDISGVDDLTFNGSGSLINLNGGDMSNFDVLQAQVGGNARINMIAGTIDMGGFGSLIDNVDEFILDNNFKIDSVGGSDTNFDIPSNDTLTIREGLDDRITINKNITFDADSGDDIIFKEGNLEVASYDGGIDSWSFTPNNTFSVDAGADIILDADRDIIFEHENIEVGKYNDFTGNWEFTPANNILMNSDVILNSTSRLEFEESLGSNPTGNGIGSILVTVDGTLRRMKIYPV